MKHHFDRHSFHTPQLPSFPTALWVKERLLRRSEALKNTIQLVGLLATARE